MLSASGANYGWDRSVPNPMGVVVTPLSCRCQRPACIASARCIPRRGVVEMRSLVGFIMVGWCACGFATAAAPPERARGMPLASLAADAFQRVNPKAPAQTATLSNPPSRFLSVTPLLPAASLWPGTARVEWLEGVLQIPLGPGTRHEEEGLAASRRASPVLAAGFSSDDRGSPYLRSALSGRLARLCGPSHGYCA